MQESNPVRTVDGSYVPTGSREVFYYSVSWLDERASISWQATINAADGSLRKALSGRIRIRIIDARHAEELVRRAVEQAIQKRIKRTGLSASC